MAPKEDKSDFNSVVTSNVVSDKYAVVSDKYAVVSDKYAVIATLDEENEEEKWSERTELITKYGTQYGSTGYPA